MDDPAGVPAQTHEHDWAYTGSRKCRGCGLTQGWDPAAPEPPQRVDCATCRHEVFAASVNVNRMEDTGCFAADIVIRCVQCDEPFRFLGLPAGISFERPMVSVTGCELRAPIEPQGDRRLFTSATFQMPPRPGGPES